MSVEFCACRTKKNPIRDICIRANVGYIIKTVHLGFVYNLAVRKKHVTYKSVIFKLVCENLNLILFSSIVR